LHNESDEELGHHRCLHHPLRNPARDQIALPPIEKPEDIVAATSTLAKGVADGDITPGESAALSTLVSNAAKAIELVALEDRIKRIEASLASR
jgi:hypothetical protein